MTDGIPGEGNPFELVSVDIEAIREAAYEEGYRKGLADGRSLGFTDGYTERGHDLIERLRTVEEFGSSEYQACIAEIEKMVDCK